MHFACAPRPCAGNWGCENENLTFYKYYTTKIFLCQSGAYFSLGGSQKSGGGFFKSNCRLERRLGIFFFPHFLYILYLKNFFPASRNFFQGFSIERFRHERFITSRTQRPTDRPIKLRGCAAGFLGGLGSGLWPLSRHGYSVPRRFSFFSHLLYILYYKNFFTANLPLYIFVVPGRRFGDSIRRRASPE